MKPNDRQWAEIRLKYRYELRRVLNSISAGTVEEVDLDKLNNFCMTAIVLMGKVPEPVWRKAERDCEIEAWIRNEVVEK